jgi:hypothetical protein
VLATSSTLELTVSVLPVDIALLRAAFPDWHIVARDRAWQATRRQTGDLTSCLPRFEALSRPELIASTPADLAVQLAALGYPLGITSAR